MPYHRILYRSDAALPGSSDDATRQLQSIVEDSQVRNTGVGLTGALLLSAGIFIQALEGPLDAIEQVFERICCDLRHRRVRLLEFAYAEERMFGEWAMVQVTPTRALQRIGPAIDSAEAVQIDAVSAGAVIQLMRSLLLTGTMPDQQPDRNARWRFDRA